MGVSVEDFRRIAARDMRERVLQQAVRDLCRTYGHLHYHTHRSERSEGGFPDSVIVARDRLLFAELKTETGRITLEQARWIEALSRSACQACGAPAAAVRIYRPSDLLSGRIAEELRP